MSQILAAVDFIRDDRTENDGGLFTGGNDFAAKCGTVAEVHFQILENTLFTVFLDRTANAALQAFAKQNFGAGGIHFRRACLVIER